LGHACLRHHSLLRQSGLLLARLQACLCLRDHAWLLTWNPLTPLLLLLKHLLSLHQLTLLLLLHLIFLQFLQVHRPLFWIHTGKHLFLLLCEMELDGVSLKLNLLSPWTPASSWVGQ